MEAGVERLQRGGKSRDVNVGETLLLVLGRFLAIGDRKGGWGRIAFLVEEVEGTMGDGRMARLEESVADGVADLVAFSINSLDVEGKAGGKGVKDDW